jgi:imidazole glycerol phosphate synthase subunit HisF
VYGHFLKPLVLRAVGQIAPHLPIPVVATGGIHHSDDARDFIDAGARAIQIDSLMWINPQQVEIIARNLGGLELTRAIGALEDEWEPGIGKTVMMKRQAEQIQARRVNPPPPPPEMPLDDEDGTSPAEPDDWDF